MCQTCQEVKTLIQEWVDKQGHDQCWFYPEIFRPIAEKLGVAPTGPLNLPPKTEFRSCCHKFENEIYEANGIASVVGNHPDCNSGVSD